MGRTTRIYCFFSLLFLGCIGVSSWATDTTGGSTDAPIRFAIIGDRTGSNVPGIYEQIISEVERLRPDFVMNVGDMIEGYTDDTVRLKEEWAEYDSTIASLSMPIHLTPGNHDILSDVQESIYRRLVGEPYYSFNHGDLHFVILDVGRWESSEELPGEQIDWLIKDLEKNAEAAFTFVFFHKPFWYNSVAEGKPDTLHSLFVRYGVDAVFNGHHHEYFSGEYDGIRYTSLGSSGGGADPSPSGLHYHFAWVTVDDDGIHIAPIKMGAVLPWNEITADERKIYSSFRNRGLTFESQTPVEPDLTVNSSRIGVVLDNTMSEVALDDSLEWTIPEGWTVEPQAMYATVPAGAKKTFYFDASCSGEVFPVPSVTTTFNYAEGKKVTVDGNLCVARQACCYPATPKPVIDGDLSESFWKDPETRLVAPGGGEMGIDSVQFYFAYDKNNLYLGAHCIDQDIDSLVGKITEQDGAIFTEDCVGYFIQPTLELDTLYQIYFNPLGAVYDVKYWHAEEGYLDGDRDFNGKYNVKTKKGDSYWSIEIQLPLEQFGVSMKKGDKIHVNFRRKQPRFETAADWQTPIDWDVNTYGLLVMM
ncbi:MAG: metallophosphoesterase [Candidatus Zixiibacteriota bacterium]|nr:MAG: metallophosphoesterase [candidate division Zixibacteria bacterium]